MGLGLFIAKTLLERTGAVLTFANGYDVDDPDPRASDRRGAVIDVTWNRASIEAARHVNEGPLGANQRIKV